MIIRAPDTLRASLFTLVLTAQLSGCGGAQRSEAPPSSPASAPAPDSALPAAGAVTVAPSSPSPPPPPPSPAPTDPPEARDVQRREARADLDRAQRDLEAAAGACEAACRALASMERATTHLCSLADVPEDQRRCDDARQRLTSAQSRVRSACGSCR